MKLSKISFWGWFNLIIGIINTCFGFIRNNNILTFIGGLCLMYFISEFALHEEKESEVE